MDACREWYRVVALAQRCTALFNCVDIGVKNPRQPEVDCRHSMKPITIQCCPGDAYDVAVTSLCVRLGIGYYSASSFSNSWIGMTVCGLCETGQHAHTSSLITPADVYPSTRPCYACHNADRVMLPELAPSEIAGHTSLAFLLDHPTVQGAAAHVSVGSSVLAGMVLMVFRLPNCACINRVPALFSKQRRRCMCCRLRRPPQW